MLSYLPGVPDELRLQIDPAFVCQHEDRPQAVRQFMAEFRLVVIDSPDAGLCLDELGQIAHIPHEAKRELLCAPDAAIPSGLKLLIELIELKCCLLKIAEFHVCRPTGTDRPAAGSGRFIRSIFPQFPRCQAVPNATFLSGLPASMYR